MLLAVDIGNSHTSFGIFENHQLKWHWRAETKSSRTPDEYGAFLFPLIERAGLSHSTWEGVAVCSVVPAAEDAFEQFCRQYWQQLPFKVHVGLDLGFGVNVKVPTEVGADRLANAAYAVERLRLPAIVVDFGTATTFDVVSEDRFYQGGLILPGVRISVEALSSRTSKLPVVDLAFPESVIGKNTVECIRSGVLYGYCEMIDGLLRRTADALGTTPEVAMTGGLASLFQQRLKFSTKLLPNLTLEGIEFLYTRNERRIRIG